MTNDIPQCGYWSLGSIIVQEPDGPVLHERAILVTFKTIEEYRAALRYFSPVFDAEPSKSTVANETSEDP